METGKRNSVIQLCRILSCIGVFLCHLGQRANFTGGLRLSTDLGQHGVEMFFLLSGYLACLSWERSENHSVKNYLWKRCIRILPMYYLSIAYFFITERFIFRDVPVDAYGIGKYRYLFLLNGIVHSADGYFWSNLGITWTIPIFMMFYILFPFMIKFVKDFKSSLLLIAMCWIMGIMTLNYYTEDYMSGFTYMVYFALGIGCCFAVKEKKKTVAAALAIAVICFNFYHGTISNGRGNYGLIFAIIILACVEKEIKNETVLKIINVLDEYTYTFYLAHGIIFCGIIDKFDFLNGQKILIAIVGSALLTFVCHNFYEKPLQRFLEKLCVS